MDSFVFVLILAVAAWLGRRRVKRLERKVAELRASLDAALVEMRAEKASLPATDMAGPLPSQAAEPVRAVTEAPNLGPEQAAPTSAIPNTEAMPVARLDAGEPPSSAEPQPQGQS